MEVGGMDGLFISFYNIAFMTTCKNCGTELIDKYCPHCGQKASTKRIELKWLLHELPHAVWHVEKGFLYNVIQLFKRPGYAIIDYIEGKRKNFFHPISYMLIILAAMYFVTHYLEIHWYDPIQDKSMSEAVARYWTEYDKSQQLWTHHYFEYMAIYIPVAGLIAWGLLRWMNRKYNYAESLVALLFILAQDVIPQIVAFFIAALVDKTSFTRTADNVVTIIVGLFLIIQFYQLGNTTVSKTRRILAGILAAALLIVWTYVVLFIQTERCTKGNNKNSLSYLFIQTIPNETIFHYRCCYYFHFAE